MWIQEQICLKIAQMKPLFLTSKNDWLFGVLCCICSMSDMQLWLHFKKKHESFAKKPWEYPREVGAIWNISGWFIAGITEGSIVLQVFNLLSIKKSQTKCHPTQTFSRASGSQMINLLASSRQFWWHFIMAEESFNKLNETKSYLSHSEVDHQRGGI